MNDRPKTPGQVAFDAYNNHGPNAGKTYDGKPIPPWGEIAEHTRERWEAGAKAAARATFSYQAGRHTDEQLSAAFAEAVRRFGAECMMHNGPLSLFTLAEILENELQAIGIGDKPPPPPPPPPAAPPSPEG
jgi:hypothetical protein